MKGITRESAGKPDGWTPARPFMVGESPSLRGLAIPNPRGPLY